MIIDSRMSVLGQQLLKELELEAAVTRRYLKLVPFDQLDFKPAPASESLGRLAVHLAEIVAWWSEVIENDRLDFEGFEPIEVASTQDLLAYYDDLLFKAKSALATLTDQEATKPWSMAHGSEVLFTLPKSQVLRLFCMHHMVHHRAQLGVYLRLLSISVPAAYGPSAEDFEVTLISPW